MINVSIVCANDSRIKWLDLNGSNFLDKSNTGNGSMIKLGLKTNNNNNNNKLYLHSH